MKRLLKAAAALVCAFGFTLAHAQMTTITASSIDMGGVPIAAGTVTFTPVNLSGIAIPFATGGGGLNAPTAFSCTITTGAITGSCSVPDSALTTPANILYSILITNTSTQKSFTLQQVPNVTGTTWALDHYGPPSPTTNVQTLQVVYGTTAPPSPCLVPSIYLQNSGGGIEYICVAGTPVRVGGATSSVVPAAMQSRLVAEYHFRDGSGTTATDSSGHGNNMSLTSTMLTPLWASGGLNFPHPASNAAQYAALIPSAVSSVGTTYVMATCLTSHSSSFISTNTVTMQSSSTSGIAFDYTGPFGTAAIYGLGTSQGNSGERTESATMPTGGCHVFTWQIPTSSGSGNDQIFDNGVEIGYSLQVNSHAFMGVGSFYLGGCNGCGNTYTVQAAQTVYGLYVFNAPLTSDEVATISRIAITEAQRQGAPVVPTPVNVSGNIIVCGVDSLSYGFPGNPSTGYCNGTNLAPTETISNYYDIGIVGRLMADALPFSAYELQAFNSPTAAHKTLILWGCTNDSQSYTKGGVLGAQAQQCVANFAAMAQEAHSLGYKVIAVPMISRNGLDTYKNTYDVQFRATWAQFADGFADVANDPVFGADGAYANTTYFHSDGIHLNTATGYPRVGGYIKNAYNKLYGSTATSYNSTSASTYTIQAADSFLSVNNTANAVALTLPSCLGYAGSWRVKVLGGGNAVTLKTATSAQTVDGTDYSVTGMTLAASSSSLFTVVPGASSTGGCTWQLN